VTTCVWCYGHGGDDGTPCPNCGAWQKRRCTGCDTVKGTCDYWKNQGRAACCPDCKHPELHRPAGGASVDAPISSTQSTGTQIRSQQWALDNIYTIAIREERYGGERGQAWAHVRRLCERFGCAVRAVRPAGEPPSINAVDPVPQAGQEGPRAHRNLNRRLFMGGASSPEGDA